MSPATYAARLATYVARYERHPSPATHYRLAQLAAHIHRRWPAVVLLLPIPPPRKQRGA